jgi:flagellar biosynthesis chaperone FliJ
MVEPVTARQLKDRDIYLQRAEEARNQANETTLENVRERCQRSEAAWMEMAARAERTEKMRADHAAAKAAQLVD